MNDEVFMEFMDDVYKHLRRYCVSVSYAHDDRPGPLGWQFGTGFLMKLRDQAFIVTAGHIAEEVSSWQAEGKLKYVHIIYTHISEQLTPYAVPLETLSFPMAPDCDAAILRLPETATTAIETHGNIFFTPADFLSGQTGTRYIALVAGYPYQGNFFAKNPAFILPEEGEWVPYTQVRLASLAFQVTLLTDKALEKGFDCEAEQLRFRPAGGRINAYPQSGITSAGGMSGGPVFAIDGTQPESYFHPKLLGMQSSQNAIDRRSGTEILELIAVSSTKLLKWIEATVQ